MPVWKSVDQFLTMVLRKKKIFFFFSIVSKSREGKQGRAIQTRSQWGTDVSYVVLLYYS